MNEMPMLMMKAWLEMAEGNDSHFMFELCPHGTLVCPHSQVHG